MPNKRIVIFFPRFYIEIAADENQIKFLNKQLPYYFKIIAEKKHPTLPIEALTWRGKKSR